MIFKNVKYICMGREQEVRSLLSRSRTAVMGMLLAVSTVGCQASSDFEGVVYDSLQGIAQSGSEDTGIYNSKEDFLQRSRVLTPLSIIFSRKDHPDHWVLQIGYGVGWVPGAFAVTKVGDGNNLNVCSPESEVKITAYNKLFAEFQPGQSASRDLIRTISRDANQDCLSFFPKQGD